MKITQIKSNILDSNVFVVEKNRHCLIVDCAVKLEKVTEIVGGCIVDGILLTHGHFDHCAYCNEYARKFGTKIYANAKVISTMADEDANYSEQRVGINDFSNLVLLDGDSKLSLGEFDVYCFSTAGHCPCCECYLIDDNLFAGDVLFENGIGRTDLIGSDKNEMIKTLEKLEGLSFNMVYSGHGEESDRATQLKNIAIFKRFLTR